MRDFMKVKGPKKKKRKYLVYEIELMFGEVVAEQKISERNKAVLVPQMCRKISTFKPIKYFTLGDLGGGRQGRTYLRL
jgi:hypothetical protein